MKTNAKLLLIDSVNAELFVALVDVETRSAEVKTCSEQRAHDRNLNKLTAGYIDKADALAVVTGPGSWTGSRVGVTATKAYALATGKPVIELRANESREQLINDACEKFNASKFIPVRDLIPYYDSDFKITPKKATT